MTDQVAGTVLAERYALEDRLGVGGMATVYRAIDLTTGSRVAVKILSREFLAKNPKEADRNIKRFRREGEILRLLAGNPYVVEFIEQGVSPAGDHFIAMELLDGEQLRFYIGRGKTAMGLRTFAYHAKHLIRGLMAIHAKNLIHRDLAPDNVVVVKTREGLPWPKFLDFGIGKSVGDELDQVTQILTIMGKPQYFSPEQARGEELGTGSDVYALGALFYEMITGHVPLEIHGIAELRRIQKEQPVSIASNREGARIPEDLQAIIMQCLEKKAEDRPTLEDVLLVVERFSDRLDAGEEFPMPAGSSDPDPTSRMPANAGAVTYQATPGLREFAAGETIGRFQVRERIGRGGMGLVYLAWDPILQREVAIKVASRVEDEKARRAILREARASSHLKSENIVTIYDAGTEAGCPYIAMEYVRGKTLAEIIENEAPLGGDRFWLLASGILDGLIYAHGGEKPVIHRDLKPANILCAGDVAKIADFGIATVTAAQQLTIGGRDHTQTGATGAEGSVLTMSPEQANNKPADHRSDIYSLGCVFYMMATGKAPFQGNQIAILYQHVTKTPDAPAKLNPALSPAGLNAVIMRCLEKDPAKRYQNVGEVKAALEPLFGSKNAHERPWHRSPLVLTSLAAIAITAIAIAFLVWGRKGLASGRVFSVARVAGTPVHSDRPRDPYVTKAAQIEIEIGAQAAGDLRATLAADFMTPVVKTISLGSDQTTMLRIPLPDPGPREPAIYSVTLERPDNPDQSKTTVLVAQDVHRPDVRFRAYGVTHEPATTPLQVVRIQDVSAVVQDPGGFDEAGKLTQLNLAWNENQHNVSFMRTRREGEADLSWVATVNARDRSDNRTEVTQLIRVVTPDVVIRDPLEDRATSSKTIHVEATARLRDQAVPIAGLDSNDLDLGEGALTARLLVGSRPSAAAPMARGVGGYVVDLPMPADAPTGLDFGFEIEILFEGEVIKRSRHRFDAIPPVITASCGGVTVSSRTPSAERARLFVQVLESKSEEIACRIDDGPGGVQGAMVVARIGEGATVQVPVDAGGRFRLPPSDAEEFTVRIEARDQAGNAAATEFTVIRKGLQITSVQLAGHEPDSEGRVFVQEDTVALRLATVGVPESDQAFARLLDDHDREQQSVKLERLGGEAQLFGTPEIRLLPEGADAVVRSLRIVFGPDAAAARAYSPDLTVVCDREPPAISVTVDGSTEEIRGLRTVSRFPTLRIRARDNVALLEKSPAQFVSWKRVDASAPDVILDPGQATVTSPAGVLDFSFLIQAPPGPPVANRFDFKVDVHDRSGRAATRSFAIVLVPPDIAILSVAEHTALAPYGESSARPLVLNRDTVAVAVRGPRDSALSYVLVVKVFPDGGAESRREYTLSTVPGPGTLEFIVPLPRVGDGRLIERGRMVFLLEGSGASRLEELATVYYLLDRELPSWSVARGTRVLSEAERGEWIKVSSLSDLRIVVSDGRGSGFDDRAIEDPENVIGRTEPTPDQITIWLKDDATFSGLAQREIKIRVRDAAGNVASIPLRVARSKERLEVKRLLNADGTEPIVRDGVIVVGKPQLQFVIDNEAVGFQGVKWIVKRGEAPIGDGFVALQDGYTPEPALIEWPAAEHAEPYGLEFLAQGATGLAAEPFHTVRVLVDTSAPVIYLLAGGRPIGKGERAAIKDFEDLRLEISDAGADLGPNPASVDIIGSSGVRVAAAVSPSRDGTSLRIRPPLPSPLGDFTIVVTARDRLGIAETKSFDVSVAASSVPWVLIGPAPRGSTRPATRPDPANTRTVTSDALREKDEERTGVKFRPVRGTADPNGPIRFFMAQTEVTNEQFLRFVEALRKDQIPRELRSSSDLGPVRKKVENMNSRFDDFRHDPNLPVVEVDWEVALGFAAWTGGRLPAKDEWVGAAGKYLLPAAEYPVFLDHGAAKSGDYWMRDPAYAVFQRAGMREVKRLPVTELLRFQSNAPFGIVGLAGNVAEWVTSEPGGRRVLGTMGGSFKYPYTNEVSSPRLDREPRLSASDAGIRVVWPAQVKAP